MGREGKRGHGRPGEKQNLIRRTLYEEMLQAAEVKCKRPEVGQINVPLKEFEVPFFGMVRRQGRTLNANICLRGSGEPLKSGEQEGSMSRPDVAVRERCLGEDRWPHTTLVHLLAGTKMTLTQCLGRPGGPSPGHIGVLTWTSGVGGWLGGQQRLVWGPRAGLGWEQRLDCGPGRRLWTSGVPHGFPRLGAPDFTSLSSLSPPPLPPPQNYLWEFKLLSHRFPGSGVPAALTCAHAAHPSRGLS